MARALGRTLPVEPAESCSELVETLLAAASRYASGCPCKKYIHIYIYTHKYEYLFISFPPCFEKSQRIFPHQISRFQGVLKKMPWRKSLQLFWAWRTRSSTLRRKGFQENVSMEHGGYSGDYSGDLMVILSLTMGLKGFFMDISIHFKESFSDFMRFQW